MTLCKNCGTVYDEFYGVCPRCGTPCQNATDTAASPLPPLGGISPAPGNTPVQSPLPPIDIAIRNTGETDGAPVTMPPLGQSLPPQQAIDPDATIPVQPSIDPDATIPVQHPIDPDATVPVQRTFDPDATIPVQHPIDPDATVPVQRTFDPDATVPVQRTFDPDATVPVQRTFDPDATTPIHRTPIQPPMPAPVNPSYQTQEIPPIGNTNPGQYGDDYNMPASRSISPSQPPKKSGSSGKIIAIILIIAVVLGGCGVGAYFLFFHNKNNPQEESSQNESSVSGNNSDAPEPATDPDSLRAGARSMNMAILNLYAGITNGTINADIPSNELKGLSIDKLPRAGASAGDREAAAEAMTIRDVVTYAQSSDRFNDTTLPYYVYTGAQVYYKEDAVGFTLTFDTTLRDIMNAQPVQPSTPESSAEESSQPESSVEESSQPESSAEPDIREQKINAALLNSAYKTLYSEVVSGTLNRGLPTSQRHGISASKLPSASASAETRKSMADVLTIADAIRYDELGTTFTEDNIGDYVYADQNIHYHAEQKGTPLTMDTTLGEIIGIEEPEPSTTSEPSTPESSVQTSSKPENSGEESSRPESSREESSRPESSAEPSTAESSADVSTTVNDPRMAELAGKWSMTYNTEKYTPEQLKEYISKEYDDFVILLQANGTCSSYFVKDGTTDVLGSGTWEVQDTLVSVTIDGGTEMFSYRDGRLYTTAWGDIAYFSKG